MAEPPKAELNHRHSAEPRRWVWLTLILIPLNVGSAGADPPTKRQALSIPRPMRNNHDAVEWPEPVRQAAFQSSASPDASGPSVLVTSQIAEPRTAEPQMAEPAAVAATSWLTLPPTRAAAFAAAHHASHAPAHQVIRAPAHLPARHPGIAPRGTAHSPLTATIHRRLQPQSATIPHATVRDVWKTPYSYGYFGASGERRWTRQHGYRDHYTQWTLR